MSVNQDLIVGRPYHVMVRLNRPRLITRTPIADYGGRELARELGCRMPMSNISDIRNFARDSPLLPAGTHVEIRGRAPGGVVAAIAFNGRTL